MSNKNLQASIELRVTTPGVDKLAQIKRDMSEIAATLARMGTSLPGNSGHAADIAQRLAAEKKLLADIERARAASAQRMANTPNTPNAPNTRSDIQSRGRTQDRAMREDARLNYTAASRDARAARDLASAGAAYNREQAAQSRARYQRDNAEHQQALQMNARYDALANAKLRARQATSRREGVMLSEAHAMNAAFDARRLQQIQASGVQHSQALAENARRTAATRQATYQRDYTDHSNALLMNTRFDAQRAAQAAAAAANTFGGRITSAMRGWGQSAGDSFVGSFRNSMNSGMAGVMAGVGVMIAAKKLYKDNVDATQVKFGLQSAYGGDADGGKARGAEQEKTLWDLSEKYGTNYATTARGSIGFLSAANAAKMPKADTDKTVAGMLATATAMGLGDDSVKQAMRALGQMVGKQFVQSEELKLQLNDSIPGIMGAAIQFVTEHSDGAVKNGGDLNLMLEGRLKDKKGNTVRLESSKFVPMFMEWLSTQKGQAALDAAEQGPKAAVSRVGNSIFALNKVMGESGATKAFTTAMKGLMSVMDAPQVVDMFRQMGVGLKALVEDLTPMASAIGTWIRNNTELIMSVGGVIGKLLIAGVALKGLGLVAGIVVGLLSPLIGLAGNLGTAFMGALKGAAALGAYILGPLIAAFTAMQAASAGGAGFMATMSAGMGGLVSTLGRLAGALGVAATAYALYNTVAGMHTQYSAQNALEASTVGKSPQELAQQRAALSAGATHANDSWVMKGMSGAAYINNRVDGLINGKRGTREEDVGGKAAKLYQDKIDKIDGLSVNEAAKTAAAEATKSAKKIEEAVKKAMGSVTTVTDAKGKKGRGAGSQANEIKSAQKEQDSKIESLDLGLAQRTRQARQELLDQELQEGLRSYKSFYEEKAKLVDAQLNEETAIIRTARDSEIATIKQALAEGTPDKATRKAADIRITTAEIEYSKKLLEIDQTRTLEKSKLAQAATKDDQRYSKRGVELGAELDKMNGRVSLDAQNGAIDAELAPEIAQATANSDTERLALLQQMLAARKEVARLAQMDEVISVSALGYANKESEIQLALQKGLLTKTEAEDAILLLKKQQAAANLVLLQQEAALATNPKVKAELEKQILAAKITVNTETARQVELENAVESSMQSAQASVLNGTRSIGGAIKDFIGGVTASVAKALTDDWAQGIVKLLKGGGGGAEGGGTNWIATAASWLGFAEGGRVVGPGTGTSDSINARLSHGEYVFTAERVKRMGGFQVMDGLGEELTPFKNGGGVVAAQAASSSGATASRALGGGSTIINMTVNTPDAASFRASNSQVLAQMQQAAGAAQRRNR